MFAWFQGQVEQLSSAFVRLIMVQLQKSSSGICELKFTSQIKIN